MNGYIVISNEWHGDRPQLRKNHFTTLSAAKNHARRIAPGQGAEVYDEAIHHVILIITGGGEELTPEEFDKRLAARKGMP